MIKNKYFINKQKITKYFLLQSTIKGMLQIFEELFGLVFVQIKGAERDKISETGKSANIVWHKDVKLFSVWDNKGEGREFSGYLYLNLHPRQGKYGHSEYDLFHSPCLLGFTLILLDISSISFTNSMAAANFNL
jgi:metallopeptidase MepB